jgi:acetyltransferase-like isoleucine patch superfamily enzyme
MGAFVRIGMDVEIRFPRNLAIGNNVQINDGVFFMNHGHITLGDGVLVAPGVKFLTVYHDYEHAFLLDDQNIPCWKKGRPEFLPITVEHEVWIGANVVLLPGCHIGHHSVIAANSVVSGRTEPFSLIGGNPARHIKKFKELGEINRL